MLGMGLGNNSNNKTKKIVRGAMKNLSNNIKEDEEANKDLEMINHINNGNGNGNGNINTNVDLGMLHTFKKMKLTMLKKWLKMY